ncbi:pilin, partial [Patescibacteria group bacterium]|nr:pilin [Patescibacteria group bacterium]
MRRPKLLRTQFILGILFLAFVLPALAVDVPKLNVKNLLDSQGDGLYMCKHDEVGVGSCDKFGSTNNPNGGGEYTLITFNVPVRATFYADKNSPSNGKKIVIDYDGVGTVLCSYELTDDGTIKTLPCSQAEGGDSAIHSYFIKGNQEPDAFVLSLAELCIVDDEGTGNDCSREWNDQVKSYNINLNITKPSDLFRCVWDGEACVVGSNDCANGHAPKAQKCTDETDKGSCERVAGGVCKILESSLLPPEEQLQIPVGLADKITNLFNWAVSLAGLLALAIIIYGGVSYAASAGNPSRISEAKKWITSAFLGL